MIPFNSELWVKFKNYVSKSEAGLSKSPSDTYALQCAPFAGAYHTNRGITFCTWKDQAKAVGAQPTYEGFLAMTDDQWNKILYRFYLVGTKNGSIKDNGIALSITEAFWGSGGYAFRNLAQALNNLGYKVTSASYLTIPMIQGANSLDAKKLFDEFWKVRLNFLSHLSNSPANIKGWTARIVEFEKIFRSYAGTIGILLVAVLGYYFYRIYSKV